MVAIRQIIAVGCLLSLAGCGSRLAYTGDWIGKVDLAPGPATPADVTLETIKLSVKDDGKYVLIVKGVPTEGRMDLTAKTQILDVDYILGRPTNRLGSGATPSYSLTWNADTTIALTGGDGLAVLLHRNPKPLNH